jgi:hypothetical protein
MVVHCIAFNQIHKKSDISISYRSFSFVTFDSTVELLINDIESEKYHSS